MARVLIVLLIAVGAVACGGGGAGSAGSSEASDAPSQSSSPSTGAGSGPDSASRSAFGSGGGRVDAASDLSEFVCEPDADGQWNASGVITNSSAQAADYRVTVVVSEGPGASLDGKRRILTDLAPDSPEPFDLKRLPAVGASDSACQVQVLRLR